MRHREAQRLGSVRRISAEIGGACPPRVRARAADRAPGLLSHATSSHALPAPTRVDSSVIRAWRRLRGLEGVSFAWRMSVGADVSGSASDREVAT
jgi:hypothetical protein